MVQSIPYDPSMVLGSIVHKSEIDVLLEISSVLGEIESCERKLNNMIMLRRKLKMTMDDMVNMEINVDKMAEKLVEVSEMVTVAANELADKAMENYPKVTELESQKNGMSAGIESPIDYSKSELKRLELAADTLELDCQYFSWDKNEERSGSSMSAFSAFTSASAGGLGWKASGTASTSASEQVSSQRKNHDIDGTLVISAKCTHKHANIFAPFVLSVDKCVTTWNYMFPDDKIPRTETGMQKICDDAEEADGEDGGGEGGGDGDGDGGGVSNSSLTLISGASYGSSFVGMVHVLKTESTESSQRFSTSASAVQASFDMALFNYKISGGASKMDSDTARSIISKMEVTSHVSLVVQGIIPTIKSNEVRLYSQTFSDSPADAAEKLASMANMNQTAQKSIHSEAQAARDEGKLSDMQNKQHESMISALQAGEVTTNRILDINTMMTAFQDYIDKAIAGEAGVPINYYLKPITKLMIAQMWMNQYCGTKFMGGDDREDEDEEEGGEEGDEEGGEEDAPADDAE